MNPFQKAGAFVARCAGLYYAAAGAAGIMYAFMTPSATAAWPGMIDLSWVGPVLLNAFWAAAGIAVVRFALPIGMFLGRNLE